MCSSFPGLASAVMPVVAACAGGHILQVCPRANPFALPTCQFLTNDGTLFRGTDSVVSVKREIAEFSAMTVQIQQESNSPGASIQTDLLSLGKSTLNLLLQQV